MEYRKGDVCSFLLKYQVEKWSDYTHTSIVKPTGSFYIPSDKLDDFYELYSKAVKYEDDLYVTEKHRDISPILIDIDFRFKKNEDEFPITRKYTDADVFELVKLYTNTIREYIDINEYKLYVMQKSSPVLDKNAVKDGIHIVIPDIVTIPSIQFIIRKNILAKCKSVFDNIKGLINTYEDIIDEAVIERNNWQMYGSKKPNCERYKITKIYQVNQTKEECQFKETEIENDSLYATMLSIRNKYDSTPIKDEKKSEISLYEEEVQKKRLAQLNKRKMNANGILQNSQNVKKNTYENVEYVQHLVEILDAERANKFTDWIRVGWCLRNIDHRLLESWIEFSKKSPKFKDGECEKIWNYMKEDGLGVGTLHMWAKQDNPEKYKELIKKDLNSLVFKSKNETHHDVANVVYFMYKHDYVCVSIKHNQWYEFKNHRWINCDSGFALRSKISTDVCKEYMNHASFWSQKGSVDDDETEQQRCAEIAKKLNGLALKLKQTAFKDNIMKECKEMFYVDKFEEKLDSNPAIIGFQNGVYDLDAFEFREGRPEDYVSYTTGINWIPYDETSKSVKDINSFFSRVFPKQHVKEYVLMLLSSFLNGAIREEKFHIWTGSGCFAKDTPIMMYDGTNKLVQDINVNDVLMGDDSKPRNVQQLFRGYSDMYKVIPIKGESFVVNGQHNLVVKANKFLKISKREYDCYRASWLEYDSKQIIKYTSKTVKTKEEASKIIESIKTKDTTVKENDIIKMTVHQYLKLTKNIKTEGISLYRPEFVDFREQKVELDPYFLGVWLGDGNTWDPAFTNADMEIVNAVRKLCDENDCNMKIYDDKGQAKTYGISGNVHRVNPIREALVKYNLLKKNKHIPEEFKVNSKEVRMQVLAGLVDTDGHYQKRSKQIEITLKNETLIDDTIWIARSLGMSCYKSQIKKKCCNNGVIGTYYRINIVGKSIHEIPVKIPYKKPEKRTYPRDPLKLSFKIERVEDGNFYGFELDGNHLFLKGDGDFTVLCNSNGKSKAIDLFDQAFGEYCCKLPITLLTQKRAASNAATSELARTKGKRFACLQEPSQDEKLNVGLMKELTGGDKIMARSLFKEPIEFKPQFKMILTCNNLPNVPSDDGGTWRRIRVVEFTSKFCENPDPLKENEFEADTDLNEKFLIWKEPFMSMLIEYYKMYIIKGITEPDEVLQCTKEYQKNNDIFLEFIETEFERSEEDMITYNDVLSSYKLWCKDNNVQPVSTKKKEFIAAISRILGRAISLNKVDAWKGWRFKKNDYDSADNLD